MSRHGIKIVLPGLLTGACALVAFSWWQGADPADTLGKRVPGMSGEPATVKGPTAVEIGEHFETFAASAPAGLDGSWPEFRGGHRDNVRATGPPLADSWPADGPPVLWSVAIGEGHAGPAVHRGRVYLLDYDEERTSDMLRCFSLANGAELWRRWYGVRIPRNHGMSRTIPAVADGHVVTIGPKCHVMCVDAETGALRWGIDLVKRYGTEIPMWYTGQCPLIDDGVAVLAPAGDSVLLTGIDCQTGEMVWETPNPDGFDMSHSSVMPAVIGGKRMYLYCGIGGIVGISAEASDRGRLLWQSTAWDRSVIAPSPVVLDNGRIFLTAGYGGGAMVIRVKLSGDAFDVAVLREYKSSEGLASEQHTPLLYDNCLFAVLPKDAGALRNEFVCVSAADPTTVLWSSGKTNRFGLGPYLLADGKFYVLSDDGTLTILQASTRGYNELAQADILDGHEAWAPMALADGRLLLRDNRSLACIDVRAGTE
mgnify:CR=1 FL=1